MSDANLRHRILLDVSSIEFKFIVRGLTGDLQPDKFPEEGREARELGKRLLLRVIRAEKDRIKHMGRHLDRLRQEDAEGSEEAQEPEEPQTPAEPVVTVLKPGSGPVVRRAQR